jgi:fumarate reductase flavoprotein subunit
MWDDAGIVRDAASLGRADSALQALSVELASFGLPANAHSRAYNLTWHDWLNLSNLVAVSRVIVAAAVARENSRGAHFRSDFPDAGDLAASTYTRVQQRDGALALSAVPVRFTRVKPGQSLVSD